MTGSAFATATAMSYGSAAVGYAAFAIRGAFGSRKSPRARLLLVSLVVTAVWAATCLAVVFDPTPGGMLAAAAADALRLGLWLLFLWDLLKRPDGSATAARGSARVAFMAVVAALIASVLVGEGSAQQLLGVEAPRVGYLLHLGLAVFGLTLVEQVVRRVQPQMRWAIKPLAIALAGVFGIELLFFADAMLFGQLDPDIWISRGFANVLVIPFLAIATARSTGWTLDLHLSRQAVFQSSALLLSGAFLLAVAGAGYFVRYVGGDWARALQIELLFAATLLVVAVASSGRFRSRLKVFVSKHFFSYRYDYREEWLRFTRALSMEGSMQRVQERAVKALADLVESPAGILWLKAESRGYVPIARYAVPPIEAVERTDGALATFLARTGWIVDVRELRADPSRYDGLVLPSWLDIFPSPWLVIPLLADAELAGFVVLTAPRAAVEIDWEVRDLLKTASRQAASYLWQIRTAEALLESRKFDSFNRMSAFVVHDLKNLVAQLSLMLKNAQRHRDNPQFQADMLVTVEHVVGRMNALMLQLRTGATPVASPRYVGLQAVLRRVCSAKQDPRLSIEFDDEPAIATLGDDERLEHVMGHLVQNALDASPPQCRVDLRVERDGDSAVVVVTDRGAGMSAEFVRERLFKPFQTTKPSGMGIGVYESAQYVTGLGGEILFESEPGRGTRVRVRLPLAASSEIARSSLKEHAA